MTVQKTGGHQYVKSVADQEKEAQETHEQLVKDSVSQKDAAAKAVGSTGTALSMVATVSEGLSAGFSAVPVVGAVFSTVAAVSQLGAAACDVTAGAVRGAAAIEQGDAAGAVNSFVGAASTGIKTVQNEANNNNGFLDAQPSPSAASTAEAAVSAGSKFGTATATTSKS